jgi:hypothetical protein
MDAYSKSQKNVYSLLVSITRQFCHIIDSLFKVLLSTTLPIDVDKHGALLIEGHDQDLFSVILEHIQTGQLRDIGVPTRDVGAMRKLLHDSRYYGTEALTNYITKKIEKKTRAPETIEESDSAMADDHEDMVQSETVPEEQWTNQLKHILNKSRVEFDEFLNKKRQEIEQLRSQAVYNLSGKELHLNVSGQLFHIAYEDILPYQKSILFQLYTQLEKENKTKSIVA